MLSILLLILKIIGAILGIFLGIIVLLAIIILFVPIRYHGAVRYVDRRDSLKYKIKISWLFHLIQADIYFKERILKWRFRVAWIKKIGGQEVKNDEEIIEKTMEEAEETSAEETNTRAVEEPEHKTYQNPEMETEYQRCEEADQNAEEESQTIEEDYLDDRASFDAMFHDDHFFHGDEWFLNEDDFSENISESEDEESEDKGHLQDKLKKFVKKIISLTDKFKCTFQSLCDKINKISKNVEKVHAFIQDEVHKKAFTRVKSALVPFLKSLLAGSLSGTLIFGFDDPYHTGQALAGAAVLFPFIGSNLQVEPDFEKSTLKASLMIHGKWPLRHLLSLFLKLVISKNIRRTYKDIRHILEGEE